MSDDLVKRLRDWEHVWPDDMEKPAGHLYEDAADRIEELEDKLSESEALLAKAVEEMKKVDEYLTRLQTPNTEPLNSVNSCGSNELRGQYTAMVRNEAREYWASLGNTLAELTGGKDE